MIILGIGLSHCASISLIIDNELVFAQEEDRFSKKRRHKGWPELTLNYLYEKFNIKPNSIDICAYCDIQTAKRIKNRINAKKNILVHHHLAHIMSGWGMIDWDDFDLLSLDGGGDYGSWQSIGSVNNRTINSWRSNCGTYLNAKGQIKYPFFKNIFKDTALGSYWSVPAVLNFGMVDNKGIGGYEGKLMGLAAFGDANKFDYNKFNYDCKFYFKKNKNFFFLKTSGHPKLGNKHFVELKNGNKMSIAEHRNKRKKGNIFSEFNLDNKDDLNIVADFAAYLQKKTEIAIEKLVELNFDKNRPLLLSGGIFSNVVINGLLNKYKNIFVTPCMGDEGLSVGASIWAAYISGHRRIKSKSIYLGYDAGKNINVNVDLIAELLHQEKVIGLIEGKMEIGPRALGARSILANPKDENINYSINTRLGRVEYMPFAPVILKEFAHDILEGWSENHLSSKHMTLVYKVREKWKKKISGVVHVDGTVRPQIIDEKTNKIYHDILRAYFNISGIPVLINTSFNVHGEPMVRTFEDGLKALKQNRIDVLVADNKITTN